MTVQEVARKVMKDTGVRQIDVAERNDTKQTTVATWLQGNSMRVDSFLKILSACGYDLIAVDRDGKNQSYRVGIESGLDVVEMSERSTEENRELFSEFMNWYRSREADTTPGSAGD